MAEWLDSVAGPGYTMAIFWTFGALLLLVVLLLLVKLVRSMTFGTFVSGGRNRKTRLAVMDATAVDSHRRLVLVRRDDIEHLLLIGGPTDVVVERDIRLGQQRRVTQPGETPRETLPQPAAPMPPPAQIPRPRVPVEPPRVSAPARSFVERPAPSAPRPTEMPSRPVSRPELSRREPSGSQQAPAAPTERSAPSMPAAAPLSVAPYAPPPPPPEELDDALLKELEVSLEETSDRGSDRRGSPSLDDEMTKLLGELSTPRR